VERILSERIAGILIITTDGAAGSYVAICYHVRSTSAPRYATRVFVVLVKYLSKPSVTVGESRRRCNALNRTTYVILMIQPTILGSKAPSAVKMPVEEPTTAVLTAARHPVTHKMSSRLIVHSPQMLSPIVLVVRHHSRTSWTTHANPAGSLFLTVREYVRRPCNADIFACLCAILETVPLVHR
jgi:hypothetical protein